MKQAWKTTGVVFWGHKMDSCEEYVYLCLLHFVLIISKIWYTSKYKNTRRAHNVMKIETFLKIKIFSLEKVYNMVS